MKKKIALAIGLILFVCVTVMSSIVYLRSRDALQASILRESRELLTAEALRIENILQGTMNDVQFLAATEPMRGMLRAKRNGGRDPVDGSTFADWKGRFEKNAVAIAKLKPQYLQIRYIDETGQERVRVNTIAGVSRIVPRKELQNKSDQPYFQDTIRAPPGTIYISPLNLNREHGRIQVPHRPVLRIAVPVNRSGVTEGILIINLDASRILSQMVNEQGHLYLVNEAGYFLKHPDPAKEFGFELGFDYRLAHVHPELADAVHRQDELIEFDERIDGEEQEEHVQGFRRVYFDPQHPGRYWVVVFDLPAGEAFAPIHSLRWQFAGWGLLAILVGAGLGYAWAERISRPLKALTTSANQIAGGSQDRPVDLPQARDEVRELAVSFNHMVDALRRLNEGLEQRVRERTAQLTAANKELEAFSYSVSHDLRAPLRSIDGFSQALLEDYADKLDDQGKKYLQRVRSATQRMGELIDDLLKLSRVTRMEMRHEAVDLSALADSALKDLRRAYPDRRVDVSIQPGLRAAGDPKLLQIMLVNLLSNAWKFTGRQPDARIEVGALDGGDGTTYYVRDNGVGFDMAYSGKLFGAFQRLHAVTDFPGTGIGLATVQRIIHRHNGSIRAEGEAGKGACFYFTLDPSTGSTTQEEAA